MGNLNSTKSIERNLAVTIPVFQQFNLINNEKDEFKFIKLPEDWWDINYSYQELNDYNTPRNDVKSKYEDYFKELPNPKYWSI